MDRRMHCLGCMKVHPVIAAVFGLALLLDGRPAQAGNVNSFRGAVLDADGHMVERFTVVVRPVVNRPVLVKRKHFAKGTFRLNDLTRQRYDIEVSAPQYIAVHMNVEFPKNGSSTALRVFVLHPVLNEKYFPGDPEGFYPDERLDDIAPEIAKESYRRGYSLHREGRLEDALAAYGDAIRLCPNYVAPLLGAGVIYLLLNRPESGLAFLRRAQELSPRNTAVRMNVAAGLLLSNDYRGAAKLLEAIARDTKDKSVPYLLLARAYYAQKKYAQAEKNANAALAADPHVLESRQILLNIALEQKNYTAVRENLVQLRELLKNHTFSAFIEDQMATLVSSNN